MDEETPFGELPAVGKTPHPVHVDRFADGTTRPGFPGPALRDGRRSELVRAGIRADGADMRAVLNERTSAIVADRGGDVGEVMTQTIRRFVETTAISEHLLDNILAFGPLTGKGRQRAAVTAYLACVDRLTRLATIIGVERKPRVVSFAEQIRAAAAANEAERARQRED